MLNEFSRKLNENFIELRLARRFHMATAEKENFKERPLAPESLKTRRAREKLLKQWEAEKEHFTEKAIEETAEKIKKWIADNSKNRIQIKKDKSIKLFNHNHDSAEVSKKVQQLSERLKTDTQHFLIGKSS